ncbi:hypothetical protein BV98_001301 [Sphingobium herbicidovorans NBRC 16415]|uniref:DUF1330 domain-containing protein n=1 Tax=Sphingobium herbicidovorans (strain ATCC 700291 / DSM 11019 / CCUG 56400 / KCTC 2939 / LMG 18315 / NBRC 16415 / MH) TaxID=1219045 RepID=A0A086PC16_SPHHM|nr:DUF1330 domain-containing protein [Sphingobium herbicidovorans]KFG90934.1 hypothetical protein BV98_001301 [Sphingobium herbicidovorans NBRC 16415]
MTVYFIAAIDRQNLEAYGEYEAGSFASLEGQDVEALAVTDSPELLEGAIPAQRMILMKFKDRDALQRWYDSPIYQKVLPIRHANADTKFIVAIDGLA